MKLDSLVYPRSRRKPAEGRILVANPASLHGDPFFDRSVVVITSYGPQGAMGVVLNKPSPLPLSHFMPKFPETEIHAFMGGPVELDRCCVMHRIPELARMEDAAQRSGKESRMDPRLECLLRYVRLHQPPQNSYRLFLGHAAWEPGQLEEEVAQGHWGVGMASPEVVFAPSDFLWEMSVVDLGPRWRFWLQLSRNEYN